MKRQAEDMSEYPGKCLRLVCKGIRCQNVIEMMDEPSDQSKPIQLYTRLVFAAPEDNGPEVTALESDGFRVRAAFDLKRTHFVLCPKCANKIYVSNHTDLDSAFPGIRDDLKKDIIPEVFDTCTGLPGEASISAEHKFDFHAVTAAPKDAPEVTPKDAPEDVPAPEITAPSSTTTM